MISLPNTAKAMIEYLMANYQLSLLVIAKKAGVSQVTIKRILQGNTPSKHTEMSLLCLCCLFLTRTL